MPHYINPEDEEHNKRVLLESLNTKDCFDVVLDIREDDALELHFNCSQELVYALYSGMPGGSLPATILLPELKK